MTCRRLVEVLASGSRRGVVAVWAVTVSAAISGTAFAADTVSPPPLGRYDARLCVATASEMPLTCGPAAADLRSGGRLRVKIDDIVYRLVLRSSQLDIALMHGSMQIDEFSADYEWVDRTLRFTDTDKNTRYEVQLLKRR